MATVSDAPGSSGDAGKPASLSAARDRRTAREVRSIGAQALAISHLEDVLADALDDGAPEGPAALLRSLAADIRDCAGSADRIASALASANETR
jgi:hypothetical protein